MKRNLIGKIGIDIDFHAESPQTRKAVLKKTREKLGKFGSIYHDRKTKHGWHFKANLFVPVDFWDSIDIRYYCGDDVKRMFYDIRRYRHGCKYFDVLFDKKTIIKRQKNNK